MFSLDPKWRFLISLMVSVAIGVSQGTLVLTNAVPVDWIKPITAWCGILAFIGSSVNTTISAMGMSNTARLAAVQPVPLPQKLDSLVENNKETVKGVITTEAVAAATSSPKVISG